MEAGNGLTSSGVTRSYTEVVRLACRLFASSRLYRPRCLVVLSCLVLSCLVLSCLVLSCLVLSCLVLSCLVLSCLVLSCLVLSCLVLSCLVCILANTPGGVKRSGLGAHAVGLLVVY